MNKRTKSQLTAVVFLAPALLGCSSTAFVKHQSSVPGPFDQTVLREQVLKYKSWTTVNPEPAKLDALRASDCADAGNPPDTPHKDKYIRVYVNEVGQEAMLRTKEPKFPVGSIVIKEKLPEQKSQAPEFFTIMVKREAGYDPGSGDWQYLIMDSAQTRIEKPSDIESCQTCHAAWAKNSDFISRVYLTPEQRRKLR